MDLELIATLVDDPNDAFWLAQTYFMTHQYSRAERLLTRPFSTSPPRHHNTPPQTHPTNSPNSVHMTNGSLKGKGREHSDAIPASIAMPPNVGSSRLPMGPVGMLGVPEAMQEGVSRLVDMSVACRYLAAQCQVRQGNWTEATELLGEANPFRDSGRSGPAVPNVDGGIKVSGSHLR